MSLWKFLYSLLEAPSEEYKDLIRWVDRENHVFRVIDTDGLAKFWGMQKNNRKTDMNYDKMSRALRQYKYGEVTKLKGHKLTFQFGDVVMKNI